MAESGYCNESEKCSDNTNQQFPCPKTNIALETGNWEYWDDPFFLGWPVFGGKLLLLGMVSLKIQNSRHTYFQQKWCHHSLHFDCVVTLFVSLHFEANVVATFTDEWMYTKISRLVLMNEQVLLKFLHGTVYCDFQPFLCGIVLSIYHQYLQTTHIMPYNLTIHNFKKLPPPPRK